MSAEGMSREALVERVAQAQAQLHAETSGVCETVRWVLNRIWR